MWLLAYWWQGIVLLALYVFIYLLYTEMKKGNTQEPFALILVKKGPIGQGQYRFSEGEIVPLYQDLPLEMQGDRVVIQNNDIYLLKNNMPPKKILLEEIFDFAGGSLQLVRWKQHARQFVN